MELNAIYSAEEGWANIEYHPNADKWYHYSPGGYRTLLDKDKFSEKLNRIVALLDMVAVRHKTQAVTLCGVDHSVRIISVTSVHLKQQRQVGAEPNMRDYHINSSQ